MLKIGVDSHIHTLFSGHAYCGVRDLVLEAKDRGLEGIGIADHFGAQFMGVHSSKDIDPPLVFSRIGHLLNTKAMPDVWHGVRIYKSVEIDIVDTNGNLFGYDLDIPHRGVNLADLVLREMEYAIASVHYIEDYDGITALQGTQMYCGALQNPKIKMLGHIGRAGIPFDIEEVVKTAKELGKMIEINNHSFHEYFGDSILKTCRAIALKCAELNCMIAVNSDAHSSAYVGLIPTAAMMLEEIDFPHELIANTSKERFDKVIGLA